MIPPHKIFTTELNHLRILLSHVPTVTRLCHSTFLFDPDRYRLAPPFSSAVSAFSSTRAGLQVDDFGSTSSREKVTNRREEASRLEVVNPTI